MKALSNHRRGSPLASPGALRLSSRVMKTINRALIVIKPKQPFLDWINSQADAPEFEVTLDSLRSEDCTAILVPEIDDYDEVWKVIEDLAPEIFETELNGWWQVPELWPVNRDFKTFKEWFDVEIHSMVGDSVKGQIRKTAEDLG